MSESGTDEQTTKSNIHTTSAPMVKKKAKPAGVKKVGTKKVKKVQTLAAYHGDIDKSEGGNARCISESNCVDEKNTESNIQTTFATMVKKKEKPAGVKKVRTKKVKKVQTLAAYHGDIDKSEGSNARCISLSNCDKQTMAKLKANSAPMRNKEALKASCHGDNDKYKEGATIDNMDPSRPFLYLEEFDPKKMQEWMDLRAAFLGNHSPNDIIIPDPTPQSVRNAFYDLCPHLGPILKKDSARCFLRLFTISDGKRWRPRPYGMYWRNRITSQTLSYIISYNALRCAKVVLEGKAPELKNCSANPNCMNPYGYFPIHEAAERFSVDMIKLLFQHGASANVRTAGDYIIEGLLPLHVAVENTCMHKYLEDNLIPTQDHQDYIYKLIYLLCLPEMKIFLDTTRVLAKETDNLVEEIWNYMKGGKLQEAAIILLAAQGQIRGDCLSKSNVNGNLQHGFDDIMHRIVIHFVDGKRVKDENGKAQENLDEMGVLSDCAFLLVDLISQAGEDLDSFIQEDSEVPHVEVLKRVSSILTNRGYCPTGESIKVENLRPYNCKISDVEAHREVTEMTHLHAVKEKAIRKKVLTGWDPTYTKRSYFPYWRSVLGSRCYVREFPSYADEDKFAPSVEQVLNFRTSATGSGCSPVPNHNLGFLERIWQLSTNYQQRKFFGTAAFTLLSRKLPGGKRCYW